MSCDWTIFRLWLFAYPSLLVVLLWLGLCGSFSFIIKLNYNNKGAKQKAFIMEEYNVSTVMNSTGMGKDPVSGTRASKITAKKLAAARLMIDLKLKEWVERMTHENETTETDNEDYKNKSNAVIDLWLEWVLLEKDAKQWKQVSEVFEKV